MAALKIEASSEMPGVETKWSVTDESELLS